MSDPRLDDALRLLRDHRPQEAEPILRGLLVLRPDDPNTLHFLGVLCHQSGRHAEALDLLRRSVERAPVAAHFRSNLAAVLGRLGRPDEAVQHLREVVRLEPQLPQGHNNLGVALESLGRLEEAAAALHEAIRLKGDYAEAHNNLGNVLLKRGPVADAVRSYRAALALRPDYPEAHGNLAAALGELGRVDEALAHHRAGVALRPDRPQAGSDLLFMLHYLHGDDPARMSDEHTRWADRHTRALHAPLSSDRDRTESATTPSSSAGDRLRVGYVSPDFRAHPVARFFEPILENHHRGRFDVFCYSDVARPDAVTERLRAYLGTTWRETKGMPDDALADLIRRDGVDLLIDLTGHMASNRLPLFACKPAPVQVSYLGYPNTTGVRAIDYRITDSLHDPPGQTEVFHAEQLVRLDPCCWCYRPDPDAPEVNDLPALAGGRVTFACLNKLIKVRPDMIALWSRILAEVPDSRLMVLAGVGAGEPAAYELFDRAGLPRDRIELVPRLPRDDYLRLYRRIDLALDTFPYNGHTTTCDALWMGVPTVTLAGRTHVSRAGLDVLTTAGLPELVATGADDYVRTAVALASDLPRLASLRRTLRENMRRCPLTDGPGLTRRLQAAYEQMIQNAEPADG